MADGGVPDSAIARMRDPSGRVVGVGFLTATDLVVTCAHVVSVAAGHAAHATEPPVTPLTVEFPLLADWRRDTCVADVVGWDPPREDGGDTALLRLRGAAPPGARPARLTVAEAVWGDQVRIFGLPADLGDGGAWVEAEMRARQGGGWLQIETEPGRRQIGPGFSGSPVWSPAARGVVGMVVAADRAAGSTTGYLLASAALAEVHPELAAPDPAEVSPYRGLDPFLEEHAGAFRGRDGLSARLAALVRHRPLIVLAGPSGSGKSSLVYAGLLPRLRAAGVRVADARPLPGVRPAALLAGAVLPVLEPDLRELDRHEEATKLAGQVETAPADKVRWLAGRLAERGGPGGLLIFVDQFEETTVDSGRALLGLLHDLVLAAPRRPDGSPAVVAVLTVRSGALDALVTSDTADAVRDGVVFVPPMSRDELRAAVRADGVAFEDGLVDRILDDAGTEPGQLPLVEFTLARLWDRRTAGQLTHRAYQELGGVSGALASFADDVYQNRFGAAERSAARRLLVRLARPEVDGGYVRQPVRLARLDGELRAVLARLSASRLVVVGKAVDGGEIVDLAHQALLQRWPLLGEWLAQERDFRMWQDGLRASLDRWQADPRDTGGLLRGGALASATRWLQARPDDLVPVERDFIVASQALDRRRVRVLRGVIAVISTLALVAAGLAGLAGYQTRQARAELRTAASRQLADDANRFRGIHPATALQLAQAAWHHDRTPDAYGALFSQYAALQAVDHIYRDMWHRDSFSNLLVSQDGSLAVVDESGLPDAWTGLPGNQPQPWKLPTGGHQYNGGTFQVSPSGRYIGFANQMGAVLVWDVRHRGAVIELAPQRAVTDPDAPIVAFLSFSTDDSRMMVVRSGYDSSRTGIEVWDIASRQRAPVADPVAADDAPIAVSFGPDAQTLAVSSFDKVAMYDLRTGRLVRTFADTGGPGVVQEFVAGNGTVVVQCREKQLRLLDARTGAVRHTYDMPDYCDVGTDATTNYVVIRGRQPTRTQSNAFIGVVEIGTGKSYRVTIPPVDLTTEREVWSSRLAIVPGPDGARIVLLADQDVLYRMRLPAPSSLAPPPEQPSGTASVGDNYTARVDAGGRISLVDTTTNATVASASGSAHPVPRTYQGDWLTFTPGATRLLIVQGRSLVVYAVPSLAVEHRLDLPEPANLGPPPTADGYNAWASSVVAMSDDRAVVLHASVLTRWNLATGQPDGAPLPLRSDPAGQRRAAVLSVVAGWRPGHPDQVAVVQPSGTVEVWSLTQRRVVDTVADAQARLDGHSVLFNTTGSLLAVLSRDGQVSLQDVDRHRASGRIIPVDDVGGLLGFTPDGELITIKPYDQQVQLWDEHSGRQLGTLDAPDTANWELRAATLTLEAPGQVRSLQLDPALWFRHLCQLSSRPYNADEKPVLEQDYAANDPPCR